MKLITCNIRDKIKKLRVRLFHIPCFMFRDGGFTLLEMLLVIGILSVLAVAGFAYYRNSVKNIEFDEAAKDIIATLNDARSRALAGQSGWNWGVNFVNSSTPYYQIFSSPTNFANGSTTIDSTYYLPGTVAFSVPSAPNGSTSILFNKITGVAATASIAIIFEGATSTISVSTIGTITR